MKILRYDHKLLIIDGRDPLQYVDLATKKLYKYPAYFDEATDLPDYKWWRNPVKWYQWRKIFRIAGKNTKIVLQTTSGSKNLFYRKPK